MEYKEIILTAIQSLRTNVMRTGLTMLGIIIGTSAVILISSIGQSAVRFVNNEISSFGSNFFSVTPGGDILSGILGGTSKPLTLEDVDAIKSADISNIDKVVPVGYVSRVVSAEDEKLSILIYGFTPEVFEVFGFETISGDLLTDSDSNSRVAVLGSDVAFDLFGEGVDPVGESIKIENTKYKVIGVIYLGGLTGAQFNSGVTIPLEVLNSDITGNDDVNEIAMSVFDQEQTKETIGQVEEVLREHRDIDPGDDNDFTISDAKEILGTVETVTLLLTALIAGISAISLVVGGVGVMNVMLVSVTERTKEIGLMKAIGAKEKDIMTQFLIESVVMTVTGGLIGIAIGVSLSIIIALVAGLPVGISVLWLVITIVVSTLVGVVFGIYPARKAASLQPIDALRYE